MASKPSVKSPKRRLDEELVRRGIADSLRAAQAFIMAGDIVVNDQRVDKAGLMVGEDAVIRQRDEGKYVSRGGDKLAGAIQDFQLADAFQGKTVLDVGASTGGFTDCCLQHGAKRVVAVDVGTNQLAWKLRNDTRVVSVEKTDIRTFQPEGEYQFDWVVADVSFNSIARLAEALARLAPTARMLLLIKPQFELPRELVPSGGVVTSDEDRETALQIATDALLQHRLVMTGQKDARIAGRTGNREIFVLIDPQSRGV